MRYGTSYTSVQAGAVKSMLHGRARATVSRSTTSRAGLGIGLPTLTRWWLSATTVTNSSDVTQRWRMTVDGC